MKKSDAFPSKFLAKEDIDQPTLLTVSNVKQETIKTKAGSEDKIIITFAGDFKPMILNKGNWTRLEVLYGDDSDNWVGKKIEIYVDPNVEFGGEIVGGLRLRAPGTNGTAEHWTWQQVIAKASAVGLNEDDVRQELRGKGLTSYKADRDTPLIQALIANSTGGGAGDEEIPI